ncbi:OsmC family protein [Bacillus sp. M6-12]|uniref:OsmC family protein n=1 Tax=Bacillus sp. M6-12 TaxID=2054166 RepID=UPI0015E07E63|nr:OsmC family protein [Bacillus sp. M6-12]
MKTTITWQNQMAFSGTTPSGHSIQMDAAPEVGGQNSGPRPTELLLNAIAGCTGIDIIMILTKMRLNPTHFSMEIDASRAEEHPKRFTGIHIHYVLKGELPEDKVVRAIKLSRDTYCSVSNSVNAAFTFSYSINGEESKQIK